MASNCSWYCQDRASCLQTPLILHLDFWVRELCELNVNHTKILVLENLLRETRNCISDSCRSYENLKGCSYIRAVLSDTKALLLHSGKDDKAVYYEDLVQFFQQSKVKCEELKNLETLTGDNLSRSLRKIILKVYRAKDKIKKVSWKKILPFAIVLLGGHLDAASATYTSKLMQEEPGLYPNGMISVPSQIQTARPFAPLTAWEYTSTYPVVKELTDDVKDMPISGIEIHRLITEAYDAYVRDLQPLYRDWFKQLDIRLASSPTITEDLVSLGPPNEQVGYSVFDAVDSTRSFLPTARYIDVKLGIRHIQNMINLKERLLIPNWYTFVVYHELGHCLTPALIVNSVLDVWMGTPHLLDPILKYAEPEFHRTCMDRIGPSYWFSPLLPSLLHEFKHQFHHDTHRMFMTGINMYVRIYMAWTTAKLNYLEPDHYMQSLAEYFAVGTEIWFGHSRGTNYNALFIQHNDPALASILTGIYGPPRAVNLHTKINPRHAMFGSIKSQEYNHDIHIVDKPSTQVRPPPEKSQIRAVEETAGASCVIS